MINKLLPYLIPICLIWSGCAPVQKPEAAATQDQIVTEVSCPGVESIGLTREITAYLQISSNQIWFLPVFQAPSDSSKKVGKLFHHTRLNLLDGPQCDLASAWWQVTASDGLTGWIEIGGELKADGTSFSADLIPFKDDAVQREVKENQQLDAQVRYILADIQLGGPDVLKYYQEETAAKPDDKELFAARIALDIQAQWGKEDLLANPTAFDLIPLRGGTSVVDAGTEFVQPGLDILLQPCDVKQPLIDACNQMKP